MGRATLSVFASFLLSGAAFPGQTAPAGVVLQSASARLNSVDAAAGTTVYDGDRLETQDKGVLSIRSGQVQLALAENSQLLMNHLNGLLTPELQAGTVSFSVETGTGVEIRADDVRVRPHSTVPTVGQVTLERCDVLVTAQTQSLDVTAGRETRTIEQGKTYRVVRVNACGAAQFHAPVAAAQSRFYIFAGAAVGVVTIWAGHEALESPDRP